jgi:curved DNA-binding protein
MGVPAGDMLGYNVKPCRNMAPQTHLKTAPPKISLTGWGPLRDAVSCLSLANISFARVWQETLSFRRTDEYFMRQIPSRSDYLAEMVAVVLLAAVFYAVVWFSRRRAGRFYPDNPDSGDIEKFLALNRVYDTLSDPDRRSNYDAKREQLEAAPDPIFSMSTFVNGIEGEVNRRLAILAMLYNKRRTNGSQPGISLWDLERKMALPREHLEFAVWYLKAKGYLAMGDNADLTLTALGVDYVETNADRNVTLDKLLHAGSKCPADSSHGKRKTEADNTPHHLIAAQSKLDNEKKQQPGYTNGTVAQN